MRARNAAITIQRAFRHYTMVKKFASITAMAKAEKRLSRRLPHEGHDLMTDENGENVSQLYMQEGIDIGANLSGQQRVCAT